MLFARFVVHQTAPLQMIQEHAQFLQIKLQLKQEDKQQATQLQVICLYLKLQKKDVNKIIINGVNNPSMAGTYPIEFSVYDGATMVAGSLVKH